MWRLAGWAWVAVMDLLGLGIVFFQAIFPQIESIEGQGTALLLVGASILFVVVFATWDWRINRLAAFASFSTAVFGFLGTSYILAKENPLLLAFLGVIALYSAVIVLGLSFFARQAFNRIQDEVSRRRRNH